MSQQDVTLWLGLVCVALAMVSFKWGRLVGLIGLAGAVAILTAALLSAIELPLEALGAAVLLALALVPMPAQRDLN